MKLIKNNYLIFLKMICAFIFTLAINLVIIKAEFCSEFHSMVISYLDDDITVLGFKGVFFHDLIFFSKH